MTTFKYPRTFHLPFSLGRSSDDKVLKNLDDFHEQHVIVTEKMDGENSTLYRDGFHARSIDGRSHPSRDWLKRFHSTIANSIPEGWRICGENLFAKHSIIYNELPSYFMGFSIWDENNVCLSWLETLEWFELLGITPVNVMWSGIFDETQISNIQTTLNTESQEGFVVRKSGAFKYEDFGKSVAKWVRPAHVQTDSHWMYSVITPNKLRSEL